MKDAIDTAADFAERLEMSFGQSEEMEKFMVMYADEKTAELKAENERLKKENFILGETNNALNGVVDEFSDMPGPKAIYVDG